MQKRSLVVVLAWVIATGLVAGAARALPSGPVVSGNGQLEFSNFQFFSPFGTVTESQVNVTVLPDGIRLSGPISATDDLKSFFVLYEVRALGAGIDFASLALDSDVEADKLGLVLATKRLLGDKNDPRDWYGDKKGKKGDDELKNKGSGRNDDIFHFDDGFAFGPFGKKLAHLKTADWDLTKKFRGPLGMGPDGAIRLVEAEFASQQTIRVIEHVVIAAKDGTATWTSSTNRFSTVPEPGTATLTLLGLGVLAARSYRKS